MVSSTVQNTHQNILTGFGGEIIESKGTITITWYANNASKTRQTTFLVAEHGPFDLLLGKEFIFSENIFMFNQAALVLRAAPISKGSYMLPAPMPSLIFCSGAIADGSQCCPEQRDQRAVGSHKAGWGSFASKSVSRAELLATVS